MKGKNLLPKFFPFREDFFSDGHWCTGKQRQKSENLSTKEAENLPCVHSPLSIWLIITHLQSGFWGPLPISTRFNIPNFNNPFSWYYQPNHLTTSYLCYYTDQYEYIAQFFWMLGPFFLLPKYIFYLQV